MTPEFEYELAKIQTMARIINSVVQPYLSKEDEASIEPNLSDISYMSQMIFEGCESLFESMGKAVSDIK